MGVFIIIILVYWSECKMRWSLDRFFDTDRPIGRSADRSMTLSSSEVRCRHRVADNFVRARHHPWPNHSQRVLLLVQWRLRHPIRPARPPSKHHRVETVTTLTAKQLQVHVGLLELILDVPEDTLMLIFKNLSTQTNRVPRG